MPEPAARELFDIAQVDTLRVYTSVPQAYAPYIKVGAKAAVTLQEFPGEKFAGAVARTAEAIDPATRTLLTEVDVVNKDGRLLPGSFGQVHFAVGSNVQKLTVPVNAMLFRAEGARVAVVGADHKIELRPLNIGRDYGATLEVLGGLAVSDQIVDQSTGLAGRRRTGQRCAALRGRPAAASRQPGRRFVMGAVDLGSKRYIMRYPQQAALAAALALLALAAGCAVGPRYQRPAATAPTVAPPPAWKTQPPWQQAAPKDSIPKGAWWQVFHDPTLDAYEQQLLQANQSLLAARDRLEQARSIARVATADLFPKLSTDPGALRQGAGANRPLNGSTVALAPYTQNVFTIPFSVSYEADLFGGVRHNVEAANATLQSTAADLQNVQLVLTAELAADYFTRCASSTPSCRW